MFAKAVAFFFALITFVNAAPIIHYTTNPDVRPIVVALSDGIRPVAGAALKREPYLVTRPAIAITQAAIGTFAQAPVVAAREFDLPLTKREAVDLDALGSRIINGLKSNGLDEYVEHFSTRIQQLKDILASDASHAKIPAEANNLLLEYRQVLASLNMNKSVKARDVFNGSILGGGGGIYRLPPGFRLNKRAGARDVDAQTISQLQAFVDNTVNLLRALGKSDAVNDFLSEINRLETEAQDGTVDASDLLSAARDVVLSIL